MATSKEYTLNWAGIHEEYLPAFVTQSHRFASATREMLTRCPISPTETWKGFLRSGFAHLKYTYGISCLGHSEIMTLVEHGRLPRQEAIDCVFAISTVILQMHRLSDPSAFKSAKASMDLCGNLIGRKPTTYLLRTGRKEAPASDDVVGWYQLGDKWGALWPDPNEAEVGNDNRYDDLVLTDSQQSVYDALQKMVELRGSEVEYVAEIWSRPFPLILASSGSGKTTVVKKLGCDLKKPVHILDSGSWTIKNASRGIENETLRELADAVENEAGGIIFVDELDKFSSHSHDWTKHVQEELKALIDGRLASFGWSSDVCLRLSQWTIIGAGTWQNKLGKRTPSVGFGGTISSGIAEIHKQTDIPAELLMRFSDRWIHLAPPTPNDIKSAISRVHRELSLTVPLDLDELATEALESGRNMRWLEGYLNQLVEIHNVLPTDEGKLLNRLRNGRADDVTSIQSGER